MLFSFLFFQHVGVFAVNCNAIKMKIFLQSKDGCHSGRFVTPYLYLWWRMDRCWITNKNSKCYITNYYYCGCKCQCVSMNSNLHIFHVQISTYNFIFPTVSSQVATSNSNHSQCEKFSSANFSMQASTFLLYLHKSQSTSFCISQNMDNFGVYCIACLLIKEVKMQL